MQEATGVVVGQRAEACQLSTGQGKPWVIGREAGACSRGERSVGGDDGEGDCGGDVELMTHRGACRVGGQQLAVGVLRQLEQRADERVVVQVGVRDERRGHGFSWRDSRPVRRSAMPLSPSNSTRWPAIAVIAA